MEPVGLRIQGLVTEDVKQQDQKVTPEPSCPVTLSLAEIFKDTWSKTPFEEQHNRLRGET